MWKQYLNTDDRSVGPCPLRGKCGAVGTKGGVFPSPEGRLFSFLNTMRNKNILLHTKHLDLYRFVFIKTMQPAFSWGNAPPLFILPRWGRCPTDLSLVFKIITFNKYKQKRIAILQVGSWSQPLSLHRFTWSMGPSVSNTRLNHKSLSVGVDEEAFVLKDDMDMAQAEGIIGIIGFCLFLTSDW